MRQVIIGLVLMGCASTASGQAIYRCIQKGKPVSYQTEPCPKGATIDRIREYVPERNPTPNELAWQRYRTEQEMAARRHREAAEAASAPRVVSVPDRSEGPSCADAKAQRDAWERRVGLSRTIDDLRAWQAYVQRACR